MPITADQILDLAATTLKDQGRFKMTQLAQDLRDYTVMNDMLKKDKVKFDGGVAIQRNVMLNRGAAAKQVGLHGRDTVNIVDHMKTVSVPWKHTVVSYGWERREFLINKGSATKILDLVKTRRQASMLDLIEHWERQFWTLPTADDGLQINGCPYWVVKNSSNGFNGGTPSGYATPPGGLTHAKWQNYTFTYGKVNKGDCLKQLRTAARKTGFKSPIDITDYRQGNGARYRIFTNDAVLDEAENLLEEQNDNLGTDLWKYDGSPTFRKSPIKTVDILNEDTADPIYMLDMSQFYPVFLEGDWMTETAPKYLDGQHNTIVVFIDATVNWICNDRRRQVVGYRNP